MPAAARGTDRPARPAQGPGPTPCRTGTLSLGVSMGDLAGDWRWAPGTKGQPPGAQHPSPRAPTPPVALESHCVWPSCPVTPPSNHRPLVLKYFSWNTASSSICVQSQSREKHGRHGLNTHSGKLAEGAPTPNPTACSHSAQPSTQPVRKHPTSGSWTLPLGGSLSASHPSFCPLHKALLWWHLKQGPPQNMTMTAHHLPAYWLVGLFCAQLPDQTASSVRTGHTPSHL